MSHFHHRELPLLGALLLVPAACKSQESPTSGRLSAPARASSAAIPARSVAPASTLTPSAPASAPTPTVSASKLPPGAQAMMSYFIDEVCEGGACDPEVELLRSAVVAYLKATCDDTWNPPSNDRKGDCKTEDDETLFTVTPLGVGAMSQAGVEEVILEIHENSPAPTLSSNYLFLMRWQDERFVPWVALRGAEPLRATSGEIIALPAIEGDRIRRLAYWHLPGEAMVQFYCTSAAFHGEFQQSCFAVSAGGAAGDLQLEFSSNTGLAALPGDRYLVRELVGFQLLESLPGEPEQAVGVKLQAEYSEGVLEEVDSGSTRQRHLVHEAHSFEIRLKDGQLVATPAVAQRYK